METGVHDVATLLKEFFRDLPEPIIPKDLHPALLSIQSEIRIMFWGRIVKQNSVLELAKPDLPVYVHM
jgi:hypothetical protein